MFGQSLVLPLCERPPEPGLTGWVVALGAGEADGSGLAAETTAAPPTRTSPAARASVAIPRRHPPPAVGGEAGTGAGVGAGVAGCSYQSMSVS